MEPSESCTCIYPGKNVLFQGERKRVCPGRSYPLSVSSHNGNQIRLPYDNKLKHRIAAAQSTQPCELRGTFRTQKCKKTGSTLISTCLLMSRLKIPWRNPSRNRYSHLLARDGRFVVLSFLFEKRRKSEGPIFLSNPRQNRHTRSRNLAAPGGTGHRNRPDILRSKKMRASLTRGGAHANCEPELPYMPDRATYTCCGASILPEMPLAFTFIVATSGLPFNGAVKPISYWFARRRSRSLK